MLALGPDHLPPNAFTAKKITKPLPFQFAGRTKPESLNCNSSSSTVPVLSQTSYLPRYLRAQRQYHFLNSPTPPDINPGSWSSHQRGIDTDCAAIDHERAFARPQALYEVTKEPAGPKQASAGYQLTSNS
jgi:hypothetical protein